MVQVQYTVSSNKPLPNATERTLVINNEAINIYHKKAEKGEKTFDKPQIQ